MALVRAHIVFFLPVLVVVFATHLPFLETPFHWDELGAFIPASLDLHREGRWIPASTLPSSHPPGLPLYLSAVWSIGGYSIVVTRIGILVLAALWAHFAFLLAVRLCRGVRGTPEMIALGLLLAAPLFHTQAMMAQLDLPAALFTTLALLLFLDGRVRAAAGACCLLLMVKESGITVPLVLGGWLVRDRRFRDAAWFVLPFLLLALWLTAVYRATGVIFGDPSFAEYNLTYPLHPVRVAAALVRRFYALAVADFQWIGLLAVMYGLRRGLFAGRPWRIAGTLAIAHVLLMSAIGGAHLERYLLPAWPIFFIAAARAFAAWRRPIGVLAPAAMAAGLLAGLFVNPPYPYPFENNLAFTRLVELQQRAAQFLAARFAGTRVSTAWPLSDALRRTDFGYVRTAILTEELPDFRPSSFAQIQQPRVLVLYSREWEPQWNWFRVPAIEQFWRRYFDYERPVTVDECRRRFGLQPVARWESRGLWVEILATRAETVQNRR